VNINQVNDMENTSNSQAMSGGTGGNQYRRTPRPAVPSKVVPPIPVAEYMLLKRPGSDEVYFDALRFRELGVDERDPGAEYYPGRNGPIVTCTGGWMKRWRHWGNRGAKDHGTIGSCDMPYVRCYEEVAYQEKVTALVKRAIDTQATSMVSLDNVCFERPFDRHWSIDRHDFFYDDLDTETRMRVDSTAGRVMGVWHNVELWGLDLATRDEWFVPVPDWFSSYEGSAFLFVATPPVFAYHTGDYKKPWGPQAIDGIAAAEFTVLSLMSFLAAAESGVMHRHSRDPRLKDNEGILMRLGPEVRLRIGEMGFLEILQGCNFDKAKAYLAYSRSSEIDWEALNMDSPFLPYDWNTGMVSDLVGSSESVPGRLDGLGRSSTQTFGSVQVQWHNVPSMTMGQAESFCGTRAHRRSLVPGVKSGGALLMQHAESQGALERLQARVRALGTRERVPLTITEAIELATGWSYRMATAAWLERGCYARRGSELARGESGQARIG